MAETPDRSKKLSLSHTLGITRKKRDKELLTSSPSSLATNPEPNSSSRPGQDIWTDVWYGIDKVLEITKNAAEVAGPVASGLHAGFYRHW